MKKYIFIVSAFSIIVFMAGFISPFKNIEEGIYTGKFNVMYPSGKSFTGKTTIEIGQSTYSCMGNKKRIPAGGSGTYLVNETESRITFTDENIWTADFDWNLILTGEYDYSVDGKKLILSRKRDDGEYYEYTLTKK
jgi:hypothetical protein